MVRIEENLKRRLNILRDIERVNGSEKMEIQWIGPRKMVLVKETTSKDEEVDLAFRKLESKNKERVLLFGNKDMGAFIAREGFSKGVYNLYENVFFFVDDEEEEYDAILPESLYATLTYKGDYDQSPEYIEGMVRHIDRDGYTVNGNPIEIYRVDIHETSREEEFITETRSHIKENSSTRYSFISIYQLFFKSHLRWTKHFENTVIDHLDEWVYLSILLGHIVSIGKSR